MYRFKLEALLNHRRNQKEAAQKELAQAYRSLAHEREKLARKKEAKQECIESLQAKRRECTSIADIRLHMNYVEQLKRDIENQAICVQKASKVVDQKREDLITIMQKHKTLKKLKHKQRQAYEQKLMQAERKLMDELASIRHARKDIAEDPR